MHYNCPPYGYAPREPLSAPVSTHGAPTPQRTLSGRLGIIVLMGLAVLFGANHIAARLAFDHGASVATAVFARSFCTAIGVLVLLRLQGVPLAITRAQLGRAAIVGLLLCVQSYCIYSAVARIPAALALLSFHTFPISLSLMLWASGRGRPSGRASIAMAAALVGLSVALDAWRVPVSAGVIWALAAGVAFAFAMLMTEVWLKQVDGRVRSVMTMATVAAIVAAIGWPAGAFRAPADGTAWLGLALLSVFYGLAITGLFVVLPRLGSANYAVALNFEPIALLGLGWLILGQAISPSQIAGAFIVVSAIAWLGISAAE
jgi:drug/metabolite transporter (DMT)-like permease